MKNAMAAGRFVLPGPLGLHGPRVARPVAEAPKGIQQKQIQIFNTYFFSPFFRFCIRVWSWHCKGSIGGLITLLLKRSGDQDPVYPKGLTRIYLNSTSNLTGSV